MRVYIAGPYTGDTASNVAAAIFAAQRIADAGHVPFVPHLYHFWEALEPNDYEFWMSLCLSWVDACDVLVRLPGDSPGADREAQRAWNNGAAVYLGVESFMDVDAGRIQRTGSQAALTREKESRASTLIDGGDMPLYQNQECHDLGMPPGTREEFIAANPDDEELPEFIDSLEIGEEATFGQKFWRVQ